MAESGADLSVTPALGKGLKITRVDYRNANPRRNFNGFELSLNGREVLLRGSGDFQGIFDSNDPSRSIPFERR